MHKKTLIQVFLILLIIIIFLLSYLKYFKEPATNSNQIVLSEKVDDKKKDESNSIQNINYTSLDVNGNKYEISALQAVISDEDPNSMYLESVVAYIYLKDSNIIKITSDYGNYNLRNYDTIFKEKVTIIYPEHKITGEYLDFSLLNNLGTISENVVYNGKKTSLFADKIEIDLITSDAKIFMNDKAKTVLIKGTN
ncbi:LPS export ABC transporter periplasmic protein LptC [Candidatus Pelagibacter sp. Uisw_092]|uniref:LPS export ABC transporter periplasmic protein LptC n=1 Tax=Candidatus Pelagibacter sp. Uisw_092 TaxID=3230979 RepID=UPI0039EB877B